MRVLVTFAVEAEFAPWRKRHSFEAREIAISKLSTTHVSYRANLADIAVQVLLTGMGWERSMYNTAKYALRVLLSEKPHLCISTGFAGALKTQYKYADIVAGIEVSSYAGGGVVHGDGRLLRVAEACGAKIADKLLTWNHVVGESKAKRAMGQFADVVDMESYFVQTTASGAQVRSIAVRSISDQLQEDLPFDFARVTDRAGRIRKRQLLVELSRRPSRIPALVGFGRRCYRAAVALADFLDEFIPAAATDLSDPKKMCLEVAAT